MPRIFVGPLSLNVQTKRRTRRRFRRIAEIYAQLNAQAQQAAAAIQDNEFQEDAHDLNDDEGSPQDHIANHGNQDSPPQDIAVNINPVQEPILEDEEEPFIGDREEPILEVEQQPIVEDEAEPIIEHEEEPLIVGNQDVAIALVDPVLDLDQQLEFVPPGNVMRVLDDNYHQEAFVQGEPWTIFDSQAAPPPNIVGGGDVLFELLITANDVQRLQIPLELGDGHFHLTPVGALAADLKAEVMLCDRDGHSWGMTVTQCAGQDFFVTRGWQGFSDWHNLEEGDRLKFCKDQRPSHFWLFHTENVKVSDIFNPNPQQFLESYFICAKVFSEDDIQCENIPVGMADIHRFFPEPTVFKLQYKSIRIKLTDDTNRDWCLAFKPLSHLAMFYSLDSDFHLIKDARGLEVGDEVRFYRPTTPYDALHFLIRVVKRKAH